LVTGPGAAAREAAIAAAVVPGVVTVIVLEGLPDGTETLAALTDVGAVQVIRIAPGCFCCSGNMILRVHLNRVLRAAPARLFLGLATATHLDRIKNFLTQAPYDDLLRLTEDVCLR
jgi:hypothetical protein